MAGSTMLRPVSITATHNTEYEQREKEYNICGVQCERIGKYSLGFTEQIVLSYSLPFPDDLYYQGMEKSLKSLLSMVIFTVRQTVSIGQAFPPLFLVIT